MHKRCFCSLALRLKVEFQRGSIGDLARLRPVLSKFGTPTESLKDGLSASPNRFRSLHEKNHQHTETPRMFNAQNNYGQGRGHSFKGGNRYGARRTEPSRPTFEIHTGSERAQMAVKNLIMKVKNMSPNYDVNFVDPGTKKFLTLSLHRLVNGLDLMKEGIRVLPVQGEGYPIIRIVPVSEMLQAYVDELAAIKQQELLDMGSSRAIRSAGMRAQAERKKSATNILTLSWSISVSDLLNQKRNEIEKRLRKDEKLIIFVGEKSSLSGIRMNAEKEDALVNQLKTSNTNWDCMDEEENALEMKKRELIFGKLQEVLQELDCKMDISGRLDARMMIIISANSKQPEGSASGKEELSPKEINRLKKLEKAKKRAQAKERKLADEDIDSLYLLKIED